MAKLLILDDVKTVQEIREALSDAAMGILVLTTREALQRAGITEDQAEQKADTYDGGGEPDVWVDVATSPDHYFFTCIT